MTSTQATSGSPFWAQASRWFETTIRQPWQRVAVWPKLYTAEDLHLAWNTYQKVTNPERSPRTNPQPGFTSLHFPFSEGEPLSPYFSGRSNLTLINLITPEDRLVLVGEQHDVTSQRYELIEALPELARQGFTHLGIEALPAMGWFDKEMILHHLIGPRLTSRLGKEAPRSKAVAQEEDVYTELAHEARRVGIAIVPIGHHPQLVEDFQRLTGEKTTDRAIAGDLLMGLRLRDILSHPGTKMIALVGAEHVRQSGIPAVVEKSLEITAKTIYYTGGTTPDTSYAAFGFPSLYTNSSLAIAAQGRGLAKERFSVHLPENHPSGVDWMIHLPQTDGPSQRIRSMNEQSIQKHHGIELPSHDAIRTLNETDSLIHLARLYALRHGLPEVVAYLNEILETASDQERKNLIRTYDLLIENYALDGFEERAAWLLTLKDQLRDDQPCLVVILAMLHHETEMLGLNDLNQLDFEIIEDCIEEVLGEENYERLEIPDSHDLPIRLMSSGLRAAEKTRILKSV